MAILKLDIKNFRNLKNTSICPVKGFNYLIGPNGSGKTSILEAIHCLGRGRSFRSHLNNQLISYGTDDLLVFGQISQGERLTSVGLNRNKTTTQIRLGGNTVNKASELASLLPLSVLETGLHTIIEGSPEYRRKFLDWGVFHVEPDFRTIWARFRRSLSQRNAAIKAGWARKAIEQWNTELVESSAIIDLYRRNYLSNITDIVTSINSGFPGIEDISLSYYQGWKLGSSYGEYLEQHFASDYERGFTQFGPHRADLRIQTRQGNAKDVLSRGQQKLCMASLVLAQCKQLDKVGISAVILVDDLASELDQENRQALLQVLHDTGAQVFITGTESSIVDEALVPISKVFHVEQGRVTPDASASM